MKILIRNDESKGWKFAEPIELKAEVELQNLLIESPSLIPIDEIREGVSPLVFAVSEFGLPGSGNTDVLAFSPDGDIVIVECKLATNPESKRKVIGQILEYASYLWGMDYEDINTRIQKLSGKNLSELIERAVAREWDEEIFRDGVKQSLKNGSFILIIVVDEINEELKRIIRYMNECSESAFSLHALEMHRFQTGRIEVLVPHLYGVSVNPPVGEGKRKKWSEEEFFKVLDENVKSDVVSIVKDLYEWGKNVADRISFGTGGERGSFTFHYLKESKTISVFTIYTDGKFTLNYGWLSTQLDQEIIEEFHRKIKEIPTFRKIPADFSKWPSIKVVDAFKDSENIEKFKQAVHWLRDMVSSRM